MACLNFVILRAVVELHKPAALQSYCLGDLHCSVHFALSQVRLGLRHTFGLKEGAEH